MSFIKKFKDMFFKPDVDDHYIIEKWKKETDEADRIKELHRQSRKQDKKALTVEDFERANQSKKNKNKTLSSNF